MPLATVMMVYMKDYLDEELLSSLRKNLLSESNLSEDEFYSKGPLIYLPHEDYDLAHMVGDPGYLLSLNSYLPYYNVGYERGDLPEFVAVAEWLEQQIAGCRVLYGEDSSGECFPFDTQIREELMSYYKQVGHEPYHRHFSPKLS